jgi:PKD repeat protein
VSAGVRREHALSDALGALLLVAVVGMAVTILGVAIISQSPQETVPALNADITTINRTILITHNGGDSLQKAETLIVVDGNDYTDLFTRDGTGWSSWSVGDYLNYTVPGVTSMPQSVSIYYVGGTAPYLLQSMGVPSAVNRSPSTAPVAAFTSDKQSGATPLTVRFTDQSTGTKPFTYQWDFNNDGSVDSTDKNPECTFTTEGTYTIRLTVTNSAGSDDEVKIGFIVVKDGPIAAFTTNKTNGVDPLVVQFMDTSTNLPTGWEWSFTNITPGNNTVTVFSTLQNPVISFGTGNYSIALTASNSAGSNTSSQKTFINVTGVISPGSFYRDITVTNSPAIANYQMKAEVPYSAHMKTDFGDIRFTGSDGTTTYSYWMEKKTDGTSAVFWVNVPAASTTNFRMYYGNASLTTTSNGTKTFDFFDDFSGDLSKWTIEKAVNVYPRIESGYLAAGGGFTSGTYGHTSLGSSPTYNVFQDGIVEFKHQHSTDAIGEVAFRGNFALNRGYKGRWDARGGSEQVFLMPPYYGWANIGTAIPKWVTAGPWHEGKMVVHGNVMDLYDDGNFKGTVTDNTYAIVGEIALQNHYGSFTNFDDVRVRKYSATEPTTIIGGEITV